MYYTTQLNLIYSDLLINHLESVPPKSYQTFKYKAWINLIISFPFQTTFEALDQKTKQEIKVRIKCFHSLVWTTKVSCF